MPYIIVATILWHFIHLPITMYLIYLCCAVRSAAGLYVPYCMHIKVCLFTYFIVCVRPLCHIAVLQLKLFHSVLVFLSLLCNVCAGQSAEVYRGHLGSYGITGELALRPVASLSGGQKSRLAFALITASRYVHVHVIRYTWFNRTHAVVWVCSGLGYPLWHMVVCVC